MAVRVPRMNDQLMKMICYHDTFEIVSMSVAIGL